MFYSDLRSVDASNGPAVRVSLFVSGCTLACAGCFNRKAWDRCAGNPFTDETLSELLRMLEPDYIAGLSLLGGDPLEPYNQKDVLNIVKAVREKFGESKTIWLWTGRTIENLFNNEVETEILLNVDCVVDGPFVIAEKDLTLPYAGSRNQRVLDREMILNEYNNKA